MRFKQESMLKMKTFFDGIQTSMQENLSNEAVVIMESQTIECKMFKEDILEQVKSINEKIDAIKTQFKDVHDD